MEHAFYMENGLRILLLTCAAQEKQESGDNAGALEFYKQAIELDSISTNPVARIGAAHILYAMKDFDSALKHINDALHCLRTFDQSEVRDMKQEILSTKGRIYQSMQSHEEALEFYKEAFKGDQVEAWKYFCRDLKDTPDTYDFEAYDANMTGESSGIDNTDITIVILE